MSSLQVALPNLQMPASYVGEVDDQSWFPQNSVPSFVPGGVSFDSTSGNFLPVQQSCSENSIIHHCTQCFSFADSLGFMGGQAPNTSMS